MPRGNVHTIHDYDAGPSFFGSLFDLRFSGIPTVMSVDPPNKSGPTIQQGTIYPTELPARPQTRQDRRICPGYRSCVPGLVLSSYSLRTNGDKELLARRICMILVLLLRTGDTILTIIYNVVWIKILSVVIGVIMLIFVAHWLHLIGSMTGVRRVLGMNVGRWTYDAFLFAMVILHAGLIVLTLGWRYQGGWAVDIIWTILGLLIFGAAWVSTWDPEPSSYPPAPSNATGPPNYSMA